MNLMLITDRTSRKIISQLHLHIVITLGISYVATMCFPGKIIICTMIGQKLNLLLKIETISVEFLTGVVSTITCLYQLNRTGRMDCTAGFRNENG